MIDRISQYFYRIANWKSILIVFLLLLPFNLWLFPQRTAKLSAYSSLEEPIFDTYFSYSFDRAKVMVDAYGKVGRNLYAVTQLTIDLVYPILFNGIFILVLSLVLPRAIKINARLQILNLLPLTTIVADYSENACIVLMLLLYPVRSVTLVRISSFFTSAKWTLGVIVGVIIIIGGVKIGLEWVLSRRDKKPS